MCPVCNKRYETDEDFTFPENFGKFVIPVDNEHFFSDHLILSGEELVSAEFIKNMMGEKEFMNMKYRNSTDLTELKPSAVAGNPLWGSQEIYGEDFGQLKILRLKRSVSGNEYE